MVAGRVTPEVAELTGLPSGIPVIAGSGDSLMTFLSSGLFVRGETLLSFGTTGWAGILTHNLHDYFNDPQQSIKGSPYILDSYIEHLGSALNWFREVMFIDDEQGITNGAPHVTGFESLDQKAIAVPPGADGLTLLPGFQTGLVDHTTGSETGVLYGLSLSHTPAHIYRALLESFGYLFRLAIKSQAANGIQVQRVACTGGGASSPIWRQIISDIIQLPLEFFTASGPCLGVAFLAAHALGFLQSMEEISGWLPKKTITYPSVEKDPRYEAAYSRFLWLRKVLQDS
jgi:xylulokinase